LRRADEDAIGFMRNGIREGILKKGAGFPVSGTGVAAADYL